MKALEQLTTTRGVVIVSNMDSRDDYKPTRARLLIDRRITLAETAFAELVLWELPERTEERPHGYKYRLVLVSNGVCVLRYDNERGKGDHVHAGGVERTYDFHDVDQLIADFNSDAKEWLDANGDP
jgi:hypothetical protein